MTTLRLKRVCRDCNSDWMGTFEEKVRFHLERMIQGQRVFVPPDAQETLAQYLTYKLMVFDWEDGEPIMPPEWAHQFYATQTIPPHTKIYAANCIEGMWRGNFRSEAIGLADIDDETFDPLTKNTKSFSVGFGDLFVFAIFSRQDLDLNLNGPGVFRLWPVNDGVLVWPMRNPIDSKFADFVAGALIRMEESPNAVDA
jgi:hypothetical protein